MAEEGVEEGKECLAFAVEGLKEPNHGWVYLYLRIVAASGSIVFSCKS